MDIYYLLKNYPLKSFILYKYKQYLASRMMMSFTNYNFNITYEEYVKMQNDMSGSTIGKYMVQHFIAKGGFGKVYKGVDLQTKERVAIKLIDLYQIKKIVDPRLSQKKMKLAKTEDMIMRICNSQNLLKCLAVYENDFLKILVLQYCNDGNLYNFIENKGRIVQDEAILILKQLLNGISELHSHKIIHRDLKSDNILIHNGIFKIADFGFSKKLKIINQNMIQRHTMLGTITNMSPEVLKRQSYGLKADIWSVGIILFQMIFGDYPFQSKDKKSLLKQIQNTQLFKKQRITYKNCTASLQMSKLLKQMLATQQQKRIGWRQLIVHPIFLTKKQIISRSLILNFDLVEPKQLEYKQNEIQSIEDYNKFLARLNITEKDTALELLSKFSYKSLNLEMKNQMTEEDKMFVWMNQNLYECLKCELIYNQILENIQGKQLLNTKRRVVKQFLYIILARCFLDMSPINLKMSKQKDKYPFISQIYPTISQLYQKIRKSFRTYCNILKTQQDKFFNRVKDWFTSNEQLNKIDKFLNGIQNQDYLKQQQVDFIQKHYIVNLIKQIKGQEEQVQNLTKYMKYYKQINLIDVKIFKNQNFDAYIRNLTRQ